MVRIQVASDLHLERVLKTPFQPLLKPIAPILALAGNLGVPHTRSYRDLLFYCSRNWDQTILVGGNVEVTADPQLTRCASIAAGFPNVHFLHKRHVDCAGLTFIGAPQFADEDLDWITYVHRHPVVLVSYFHPSIYLRVQVHTTISSDSPSIVEIPAVATTTDESAADSESAPQTHEGRSQNSGKARMQ